VLPAITKKHSSPDNLGNANRFETALQWLPVGTNQYRAAGFQRTMCKVIFQLCSVTAQKKLFFINFVLCVTQVIENQMEL
jgi:hypothetical protein